MSHTQLHRKGTEKVLNDDNEADSGDSEVFHLVGRHHSHIFSSLQSPMLSKPKEP